MSSREGIDGLDECDLLRQGSVALLKGSVNRSHSIREFDRGIDRLIEGPPSYRACHTVPFEFRKSLMEDRHPLVARHLQQLQSLDVVHLIVEIIFANHQRRQRRLRIEEGEMKRLSERDAALLLTFLRFRKVVPHNIGLKIVGHKAPWVVEGALTLGSPT